MVIDMKVVATEPINIVSPQLTPITLSAPNVVQTTSTSDYNELINKPTINGTVVEGNKLSEDFDIYGTDNPETFVYTQTTPSAVWEIKHNLNKFPSITVCDSAGSVVIGEYNFVDLNTVICTFSGAFSGECYLN